MEPSQRRIIEKNIKKLTPLIEFEEIIEPLLERRVFNQVMINDFQKQAGKSDQIVCLLEELPKRGPDAFNNFIDVLLEKKYIDAVRILAPGKLNLLSFKEVEVLYSSNIHEGQFTYKMNTRPRGLCLVINNVNFKDDVREGSDVDAQRFLSLFSQMGYKCIIAKDLKRKKMLQALRIFANDPRHADLDSAIVVILTHGGENCVLGTDCKPIYENNLMDIFSNHNTNLQNKPKMFFIQACRGHKMDQGIKIIKQIKQSHDKFDSQKMSQTTVPTFSDILFFYPTLVNNVAARNECTGSWLCNAIVDVFSKMAKDTDLQEMLNHVSHHISQRRASSGHMQSPEASLRLWRKKLYFNPFQLSPREREIEEMIIDEDDDKKAKFCGCM